MDLSKNIGINSQILRYMEMVQIKEIPACKEQHQLILHIKKEFKKGDIYTDDKLLSDYLKLLKYFPYKDFFEWQRFIFALKNCTFYKDNNTPRWSKVLILGGRGLGKDGFISFDSFALTSPINPARYYNVDICANTKEQAMTAVNDIRRVLDEPSQTKLLFRNYYWNKEHVKGRENHGVVLGHTNAPKNKDGLRPGQIVFNEIHEYKNYDNIEVFTSALGKVQHPRTVYITTNGHVRGGVLDDLLDLSFDILNGEHEDNGFLPFICRLDNKNEIHNKKYWQKANPSLPYFPTLQREMEERYIDWKRNPETNTDFMTKRMNLPEKNKELSVASYEDIKATYKELPDMTGWDCVVGIDYTKVNDIASVTFHFKQGEKRYDINHSWLCLNSADLHRIKAPYKSWGEYLTLVDSVEIHPDLISEYIFKMGRRYNILAIAVDSFRYALLKKSLENIGFTADGEDRNIILVRPSNIMQIVPIIERCFINQYFTWEDNPCLRWATNNTKKIRSGRRSGEDTGNYYYAKIEGRSRKTDPFMSLVAAMTLEDRLEEEGNSEILDIIYF